MPAQSKADRPVLDESRNPLRASNIRAGIVDKKPRGHQKITRKNQSLPTYVKYNFLFVVPRRRNHVHRSIAEIDLSDTVRPIRELVVTPHAVDIKSNHLSIRKKCELRITRAMVKVSMAMHDKQRKFCARLSRKQPHHRVC